MNPQQARATVAETFPQPFHRARFLEFTRNLLNQFDESKAAQWNAAYVKDAFKPHVARFERLGTYTTRRQRKARRADGPPDDRIQARARPHRHPQLRRRPSQATRTRRTPPWSPSSRPPNASGASPTSRWSMPPSRRSPARSASRRRLTPARRFSYIVGEGESCHTAQSRFLGLLQDTENDPTLAQIEDAFSVEAVTKEFFKQYAPCSKTSRRNSRNSPPRTRPSATNSSKKH